MNYFGFAIADSMFIGDCKIEHRSLSLEQAKALIKQGVTPCLNPSHRPTIEAMRNRFGINLPIPATPTQVALGKGDGVIVMSVRGLPRLTDRHEYSQEEIAKATFSFSIYMVID
jgi:hypothetical protein